MKEEHKTRIDKILSRHRAGQLSSDETRMRLNRIYQRENLAWIFLTGLSLLSWIVYIAAAFLFTNDY